jgi:hypothetical protein
VNIKATIIKIKAITYKEKIFTYILDYNRVNFY